MKTLFNKIDFKHITRLYFLLVIAFAVSGYRVFLYPAMVLFVLMLVKLVPVIRAGKKHKGV